MTSDDPTDPLDLPGMITYRLPPLAEQTPAGSAEPDKLIIEESDLDLDLARQIMDDGAADVECDACGYGARIEPDADYPCPECGEGRLTSPLRKWGLI